MIIVYYIVSLYIYIYIHKVIYIYIYIYSIPIPSCKEVTSQLRTRVTQVYSQPGQSQSIAE